MEPQDQRYHTVLRVELPPIKKARGLHRSMGLSHIVCPPRDSTRDSGITSCSQQGDTSLPSPALQGQGPDIPVNSPQSSDFNDIWVPQEQNALDIDHHSSYPDNSISSSSSSCGQQKKAPGLAKHHNDEIHLEPSPKRQRQWPQKPLPRFTNTTSIVTATSPISLLFSSDDNSADHSVLSTSSFDDLEDSL